MNTDKKHIGRPPLNKGEKSEKSTITLAASQMEHARTVAAEKFSGNLSRYIQSLIESDLSGPKASATGDGKRVIEELAERWRPDVAAEIAATTPPEIDQKRLLGVLLAAIPHYFKAQEELIKTNEALKSEVGEVAEIAANIFPKSGPGYIPSEIRIVPGIFADFIHANIEIQTDTFIAEFDPAKPDAVRRCANAATGFVRTSGAGPMKNLIRAYGAVVNRIREEHEKSKIGSALRSIFSFGFGEKPAAKKALAGKTKTK